MEIDGFESIRIETFGTARYFRVLCLFLLLLPGHGGGGDKGDAAVFQGIPRKGKMVMVDGRIDLGPTRAAAGEAPRKRWRQAESRIHFLQ